MRITIRYIGVVIGMIYRLRKVEFSLSLYTIYYTC